MNNILIWISARHLISEFLDWAESTKGESFSHAIFRRAKVSKPNQLTDRQLLLCELATEYIALEEEKRNAYTLQTSVV